MRRPRPSHDLKACDRALLSAILFVIVSAFAAGSTREARAGEPGFAERFALATDREAALEELIPGTSDYYYYSTLHAQNERDLERADALLGAWKARFGETSRFDEMRLRQALLSYGRDPAATLEFLRRELGLSFRHQRDAESTTRLPSSLDSKVLAREAWIEQALSGNRTQRFSTSAFRWFARRDLDADTRHEFLMRLENPDVPNLARLVVADLAHSATGGHFGRLPIHGKLLLSQLDECLERRPSLLDDSTFVATYCARLSPAPDEAIESDPADRLAYLNRLWNFVRTLSPAFHPLRAHVLYHRLAHDRAAGEWNRDRFLQYLALPRQVPYVNPDFLRRRDVRGAVFSLGGNQPTALPVIHDDRELVESYLQHFFVTEDSFEAFAEFVRDDVVRRLFVEAKVLAGVGDPERWYSLLDDPAAFEELRDRVELSFAATQRTHFASDEQVVLEVDVKNVPQLFVKVFEIDAFNYYKRHDTPIDSTLELDGLVATEETSIRYDEPPTRRVRRTFEIETPPGSGLFVVDLIGNGINSRAVIRKGGLHAVESVTAFGHAFRIFDERNRPAKGASIWLDGFEYPPTEDGTIVIPFTNKPDRQKILLRQGSSTSLGHFWHRNEVYRLTAPVYVDREALRAGGTAEIVVRPQLTMHDTAVPVERLDEVTLVVQSRDLDGIESRTEVRDFEVFDDRESIHEITVPDRLVWLSVHIEATVEVTSRGDDQDLVSDAATFTLNAIDRTHTTEAPSFGKTSDGWFLDVLGKNGEPQPRVSVNLSFAHRDFTFERRAQLETSATGRIELGDLSGIVSVTAAMPSGTFTWYPTNAGSSWPARLTAAVDATIRLPYEGSADDLSVLELRGNAYYESRRDRMTVADGFVRLADLDAGDYELRSVTGESTRIAIGDGEEHGDWILTDARYLERSDTQRLQIRALEREGDRLRVSIANATPSTRVHLVATRFDAAYDPHRHLELDREPQPRSGRIEFPASDFQSGRAISDEYRYILERRYARKFPGNMLERPGLLLNPWAFEDAGDTFAAGGGAGGRFGGRSGTAHGGKAAEKKRQRERSEEAGLFANLDFLPNGSLLLANQRPGDDGSIEVDLAGLDEHQQIVAIAVDGFETVSKSIGLPAAELDARDLRLANGIAPSRHAVLRKTVEIVRAGESVALGRTTDDEFEAYGTLERVFDLLVTLSDDETLREMRFLVDWASLDDDEKRQRYSDHACHELHVFLKRRDQEFFDGVVRPYLENKMETTFLDDFVLERDLSKYLTAWRYAELNVAERILLAQALPDEAARTLRHVRDQVALRPVDPQAQFELFESATRRGLSAADEEDGLEMIGIGGGQGGAFSQRRRGRMGAELRREVEAEEFDAVSSEAPEEAGVNAFAPPASANDDKRAAGKPFYVRPNDTKEYLESQYYRLPPGEDDSDLIPWNAFWLDLAASKGERPFLSSHFAMTAGSRTEALLAIALLDLPFESGERTVERGDTTATLTSTEPFVLYRRELEDAEIATGAGEILVQQNLFDVADRHREENGRRVDRFLSEEFVAGRAYGCQVVLTNPTSSARVLEVLLQVPEGALPLAGSLETVSRTVAMNAFETTRLEYAFYFPAAGTKEHYPVHVSEDGALVGYAAAMPLNVVESATIVDETSWDWVSQNAEPAAVLTFLENANVERLDLGRIAWRMRDREFFDAALDLLRDRRKFERVLWAYSVHHRAEPAIREFLSFESNVLRRAGHALASPLLDVDPEARGWLRHLEYRPLHLPRAHRLGAEATIENERIFVTYSRFCEILTYFPRLDDELRMRAAYYLLLQDRIEEALAMFARVSRDAIDMKLQFDAMTAYLDFFSDEPSAAREIAARYADHPVEAWRDTFRAMRDQLAEIDGNRTGGASGEAEAGETERLASTEPTLSLAIDSGRIEIGHRNLAQCEVRYYPMDVELLFSVSPFVRRDEGAFSFLKPRSSQSVTLPADATAVTVDVPDEFKSGNLIVEVRGGGISRCLAYYAHDLDVFWMTNYGQLEVRQRSTGKPLPRTYVKVYAKTAGSRDPIFYKDGYTDLRGRFDYVSLSNSTLDRVESLSILVLSETAGAIIEEVQPPKQ